MDQDFDLSNPFIHDTSQYTRQLQLPSYYRQDCRWLLAAWTKADPDYIQEWVTDQLKPGAKFEFNDREVTYLARKENGDREKRTTTLWKYIKDSIDKKEIIAPTLTTYCSPDEQESLLGQYVNTKIRVRKVAKKNKKKAEVDKNVFLQNFYEGEQKNHKTFANALSGGQVTQGSAISNKTAHSTLTSNCRATAAYGNANNEKFVTGNRHYWRPEIVLYNIASIMRLTDIVNVKQVCDKYQLHYPSVDEVMKVVQYSTDLYWRDQARLDLIRTSVEHMTEVERAAFVYVGDLYQLKQFNPDFVRTLIDGLSTRVEGKIDGNPMDIIKTFTEDQIILVHQICSDLVVGIGLEHGKLSREAQTTIALTGAYIQRTVAKYADLIRSFWVTKNAPASVAHFPASVRRCVLTGDTDSTIFTVQDWALWRCGNDAYKTWGDAVAGAVIYLTSSGITHLLAMMSANFGIPERNLFLISMKNEYKFNPFIMTNLGKHYLAMIFTQEGAVKEIQKPEIKGVQLRAANVPATIMSQAKDMMVELMKKISSGTKIKILDYYTKVAAIEREIMRSIRASEPTYLKSAKIKDKNSYEHGPDKSPYKHHYFWNEVFGPDYGEVPDPPYDTMKINTTTSNPTKMKQWIETMGNQEIAQRIKTNLENTARKFIKTFYVPSTVLAEKGIPDELLEVVDLRKIVGEMCKVFYIVLETIGECTYGEKHVRRLMSDYY